MSFNVVGENMKNNFNNPIMPGADPFVLLYEGKYYLYCTVEGGKQDGYFVYESEGLLHWENRGLCLNKEDVKGDKWFWAPEVLYRNGKFYMVYSSEEHIGMAVADSPLGPFKQKEKKWLYEEKAIDGHMFVDDDGTVYLYYVRLHDGNQIYVAKLSEDLESIDTLYEHCLIKAEEPWETIDCLVAEGPFVLKHHGVYYLTYSANHYRCKDYAVGVAMASSPLGPFEKFKGNPILHKNDRFCGVGHHSFTTTKDRKTLICAYHCHCDMNQCAPRMFCLNKAEFIEGKNGVDELVIHGPKSVDQY